MWKILFLFKTLNFYVTLIWTHFFFRNVEVRISFSKFSSKIVFFRIFALNLNFRNLFFLNRILRNRLFRIPKALQISKVLKVKAFRVPNCSIWYSIWVAAAAKQNARMVEGRKDVQLRRDARQVCHSTWWGMARKI